MALPPVKSKQYPVLKLASFDTMNFVIATTSSTVQHLCMAEEVDNNMIAQMNLKGQGIFSYIYSWWHQKKGSESQSI